MTVYVDEAIHPFGTMLMCHMWADRLDDLLAMVDRIGVQRKWIQGHPTLSFGKHKDASWVHFDVSKGKRERALQHGAVATDRYGCLEFLARQDIASGDPALCRRGRQKLASVLRIRGQPVFRFSEGYHLLIHYPRQGIV